MPRIGEKMDTQSLMEYKQRTNKQQTDRRKIHLTGCYLSTKQQHHTLLILHHATITVTTAAKSHYDHRNKQQQQ